MKAEQLWASILQEAIQGKLVPQLESEPVVEQIGETPEDVPFDIPEKWKWVFLKSLVQPAKQKKPDRDFIYVDVSSIDNKNHEISNAKFIEAHNAPSRARKVIEYGMVLYATVRPYLKNICIAQQNAIKESIASTAFACMKCKDSLLNKYLLAVLISPWADQYVTSVQKGVAYPAVSDKDFYELLVPLPPTDEQIRICATLDQMKVLINSYEQEQIKLEKLEKEFSGKLKSSILQEAIQGKLVPQLESEPEPDINDIDIASENVPFSIPKKWKWVRFGSIGTFSSPRRIHKSQWRSHGIPFLRARELANLADTGILENELFIDEEIFEERKFKGEVAQVGDLVFTAVGTLGKCYVVKRNDIFFCKDTNTLRFSNHRQNPEFLKLLFTTPYMQACFKNEAKGSTVKNLTIGIMSNILLPLPPVEEQKRIVDKVNRIFSSLNLIS